MTFKEFCDDRAFFFHEQGIILKEHGRDLRLLDYEGWTSLWTQFNHHLFYGDLEKLQTITFLKDEVKWELGKGFSINGKQLILYCLKCVRHTPLKFMKKAKKLAWIKIVIYFGIT